MTTHRSTQDQHEAARWDSVRAAVTALLATAGRGVTHVVLDHLEYYGQIALDDGDWMFIEVVSNRFLDDFALTPAQEFALIELGWQLPLGEGQPNFWQQIPRDALSEGVERLATALRCVYGVAANDIDIRIELP